MIAWERQYCHAVVHTILFITGFWTYCGEHKLWCCLLDFVRPVNFPKEIVQQRLQKQTIIQTCFKSVRDKSDKSSRLAAVLNQDDE